MRTSRLMNVVVAVAVLAACGDDSPSADSAPASDTPATPAPAPPPSSPPTTVAPDFEPAPGEEWFGYQEAAGGYQQIFVVRRDGSGRRHLAPGVGAGHQTNPDWSPDGERLVFAVSNGNTDDLWVVGLDGSPAELLLECVDPCVAFDDPAWSPDGESIVFSRHAMAPSGEIGTGALERIDLASGEVTVLVTAPEPDFLAGQRLSPDGTKVVLEWVRTNGTAPWEAITGVELAVIDLTVDPPTMQPITDAALFAVTADWSPDGSTIVYSALPTPDAAAPELFSIRPDGTGLTQLTFVTESGGSAEHPDFVGDGATIVFVGSADGTGSALVQLDVATGELSPAIGNEYVTGTHPRSRLR